MDQQTNQQNNPQQRPFIVKRELKVEQSAPGGEISTGTWFLMGGTALFFDVTGALLNLIPVAGQILAEGNDMFTDATFWLWFTLKGSKYSKKTMFGTFIVKFIPILNMLPEYTLMIILMYMQSKAKKAEQKVVDGEKLVKKFKQAA